MKGDRGPWVKLTTGRLWHPYDPSSDEVYVGDLRALAYVNRFGGHAGRYSVAQHCVLVCTQLRLDGHDEETQLLGLIHDAHEAYPPGDVASPVKRRSKSDERQDHIALSLKRLEGDAARVVRSALLPHNQALALSEKDPKWSTVHHYDLRALATEARLFFGYDPSDAEQVAIWGALPEPFDTTPGLFDEDLVWRWWKAEFDALSKAVGGQR